MHAYSNVDWVNDLKDRKSITKFCIFFGGILLFLRKAKNKLLFIDLLQELSIVLRHLPLVR